MGSGPSSGDVCFQVSFKSALLTTSLESCLFCFISTFGLSAGTNFSLYYRSNKCSLRTIVAQSYKFYLLILQAVLKGVLWTIHNTRASCLPHPALSRELQGTSGFEFNESWNKAVSRWVQWLRYLNDKAQSIFCLKNSCWGKPCSQESPGSFFACPTWPICFCKP